MTMIRPEVESSRCWSWCHTSCSSLTLPFSDNEDFVNHSTLHIPYLLNRGHELWRLHKINSINDIYYYFQLIFHSYLRKNEKISRMSLHCILKSMGWKFLAKALRYYYSVKIIMQNKTMVLTFITSFLYFLHRISTILKNISSALSSVIYPMPISKTLQTSLL